MNGRQICCAMARIGVLSSLPMRKRGALQPLRRDFVMSTRKLVLLLVTVLLLAGPSAAQEQKYLYRATMLQAAPGRLLELIEVCKTKQQSDVKAGDEPSLMMRHSQGDKWDLLLLTPMESYSLYYQEGRIQSRAIYESAARGLTKAGSLVAWREDVFVYGPPLEDLRKAFEGGAFFHVEMMEALPGMAGALRHEREMENTYSRELKRPENFIFVRDQGAAWDIFTIGVYRDIKHYAEAADIPVKLQEEAAKKAGFDSASAIGPYLRNFIRTHHDTLAVAVK
jgi:hypothetical protein